MTTPKCRRCSGPHDFNYASDCISYLAGQNVSLAERVAALEAKQVPARYAFSHTECDLHNNCMTGTGDQVFVSHKNSRDLYISVSPVSPPAEKAEARTCAAVLNPAPGKPLETCRLPAGHAGGHDWPSEPARPLNPAPAVPKADPARCSLCPDGSHSFRRPAGSTSASSCWDDVCANCRWTRRDAASTKINPASESTPDVPGPVSDDPKSRRFDVGPGFVRAKECPDCLHTRCGEGCNCDCDAARAEYEAASLRTEAEQLRAEVARLNALLDDSRAERKRLHHETEVAANRVEELEADVARLRAAGSAGGSGLGEAVRAWRVLHEDYRDTCMIPLRSASALYVDGTGSKRAVELAIRVLEEAAAAPAETKGGE